MTPLEIPSAWQTLLQDLRLEGYAWCGLRHAWLRRQQTLPDPVTVQPTPLYAVLRAIHVCLLSTFFGSF